MGYFADPLFIGVEADLYFEGRVEGRGDPTFLSILRALLHSRIGEDEVSFNTSRIGTWDETIFSGKNVINHVDFVFSDSPTKAFNAKNLSCRCGEWRCVNKIQLFMSQFAPDLSASCYINYDLKSALFFLHGVWKPVYSYQLGSVIPAALPWYFKNSPLTQPEKDFLGNLSGKNGFEEERILEFMDDLYVQLDIGGKYLRESLIGIGSVKARKELDSCEKSLAHNYDRFLRAKNEFSEAIRQRESLQQDILKWEGVIAGKGNDDEFLDYFSHNKSLVLDNVSGSSICFMVKTKANYYDKDELERLFQNPNSYLFAFSQDILMLVKAIFIEEVLHLNLCTLFRIVVGSSAEALLNAEFPRRFSNYLPNPHLNIYGCLGGYELIISDLLVTGDDIGVIETCVAASGSLTWGDSICMRAMLTEFSITNRTCIELPDGSMKTPMNAIDWLKEQEEKA